jgi:protein transport protein SEC23
MYKGACDYYRALSERAMAHSVVVDLFACSLDQIGALELKPLVARSGGLIVLADSFGQSVFRESLRRVFERDVIPDPAAEQGAPSSSGEGAATGPLQMGFGGHIEVIHSREFKIAGVFLYLICV